MAIFVRGVAVCDGCGRVAAMDASYSARDGDTHLWWNMPKGWLLHERGQNSAHAYCNYDCQKGYAQPDRIGKGEPEVAAHAFDARAVHKLTELLEAKQGVAADDLLAAFEAVLVAWRKKGQTG